MTCNAVSSEWGTEQEKTRQQVQAVIQAALPPGPYDPAAIIVVEVSGLDKTPCGVYGNPYHVNHNIDPLGYRTGLAIFSRELYAIQKSVPGMTMGKALDHGTSCDFDQTCLS